MRIAFTATAEDYVAACTAHSWRRYSRKVKRFQQIVQPILGVVFLSCAVVFYRWAETGTAILNGLVGLYLLLAPKILAPWLYRHYYRQTRGKTGERIFQFDPDGVHCEIPGTSSGRMGWDAFLGVLDGLTVTLLYLSPASFLYVPKRAFDAAEHDDLLAMFRNKGVPFTYPKVKKTS